MVRTHLVWREALHVGGGQQVLQVLAQVRDVRVH